jgi:predicted dehydrogenase
MDRRNFIKGASGVTTALGAAGAAFGAQTANKSAGRIIGANDRINIGVIGCGGRGTYVAREFATAGKTDNSCQIVVVCDTYQKRLNKNKETHKCDGTLDYREVIARKDVDAVIVATPDHWHANVALAAMNAGKDVYCEKPMCHTIEEAHQLSTTVKKTQRIMQVGSQTTSGDQWHKAKKAIADGAIGKMILSQGSYHRNSIEGEWNYPIDKEAGPTGKGEDYIDWKMWLGNAPQREYNADRFFRFRKYWDYSGGIATDLFFHVVAPMNICWGQPQFPHKVSSGGGIYIFKDEREVPDTFHMIADYPAGHSLVLSSSMANSEHIPGLIRGHEGTLIMVENGRFEGYSPYVTVKPEVIRRGGESRTITPEYEAKFGKVPFKIAVEENNAMQTHVTNFLSCIRTRQQPTLHVDIAARAQCVITMAVQSYRQGKVLYFDEKTWKIVDKPPMA